MEAGLVPSSPSATASGVVSSSPVAAFNRQALLSLLTINGTADQIFMNLSGPAATLKMILH
jgi:hypothetical protein